MPLALVVDDSAAERRMIGGILAESNGLRINYAQDGHEALEQIALERPDIIVTDLVMPGMDGQVWLPREPMLDPAPAFASTETDDSGAARTRASATTAPFAIAFLTAGKEEVVM